MPQPGRFWENQSNQSLCAGCCRFIIRGSSGSTPLPPQRRRRFVPGFRIADRNAAHGPRTLVTDPADATASPFGWHDINGAAGAEYTYPRGNNVYAFEDSDGNGAPPSGTPGPSGGASLKFDFPFDPNACLPPTWMLQSPMCSIPATRCTTSVTVMGSMKWRAIFRQTTTARVVRAETPCWPLLSMAIPKTTPAS